jgi:hypothetical protein
MQLRNRDLFENLPIFICSSVIDPVDPSLVQENDCDDSSELSVHCRNLPIPARLLTEDDVITETRQSMDWIQSCQAVGQHQD